MPALFFVDWKKFACGDFFETLHAFRPQKARLLRATLQDCFSRGFRSNPR
jgi:hypothetical protein